MPELPDIVVYIEALRPRIVGHAIRRVTVYSPFVVRSFDPPIDALVGRTICAVERLGKRIVIAFDGDLFLVIHLMIAGRLRWFAADAARRGPPESKRRRGKIDLAALEFDSGVLVLTEASQKKRASLHVVKGWEGLTEHDPGGIDVLTAGLSDFQIALRRENHTLKRVLTDPRLFSGIGNAYSDEILHAARLSPVALTGTLSDEECMQLHEAVRATLTHWTQRLREQFADRFPGPGQITAFREDFAVHGRFKKPCPVCGKPVQRIRYAENETNYCAVCQTGGRVLADRSLSRLLKDDWPRRIEDW